MRGPRAACCGPRHRPSPASLRSRPLPAGEVQKRSRSRGAIAREFCQTAMAVARIERSAIREDLNASILLPDFASLHPGYETKKASGTPAGA